MTGWTSAAKSSIGSSLGCAPPAASRPRTRRRSWSAAAADERVLAAWIGRREQGEPLAWILGTTTFCGRPVHVDEGVYVPRPQTEDLAPTRGRVVPGRRARGRPVHGVGSGGDPSRCRPSVGHRVGTDVDGRSVRCAAAQRCGGRPRRPGRAVPFREAVDVVTAVAPYVPTGAIGLLPADVGRHDRRCRARWRRRRSRCRPACRRRCRAGPAARRPAPDRDRRREQADGARPVARRVRRGEPCGGTPTATYGGLSARRLGPRS